MKIPGPDHPITVKPAGRHVRVVAGGETIAETDRALELKEASYPAVYYIPREDAVMAKLAQTSHSTHCPYKGDASYFSIRTGNGETANAIWSYEEPFPAVAEIKGYLAFYPDRVDRIEVG